uniref:Uncharacterized protein AlNc14C197G8601 n=1 Tax=Albugo laibachii Nc14 TaxID=890382 RepID=F0WQC1_9STRA|nr:conserved hypothetical protein [Albugo laibachii Nc14]|eukprot:CCA23529.1 conserved hypothetical protein [Albugo laibachii Nc14]
MNATQSASPATATLNQTQAKVPVIHLDFQYRQVDTILAITYAIACLFAAWAFAIHYNSAVRQKATVVFYLLMCSTSLVRTLWFASPYGVYSVTYKPTKVHMGDDGWVEALVAEVMEMLGNMLMYSIFILIVVYWAHMLRRLVLHESIRLYPFRYFCAIVGVMFAIELIALILFFTDSIDSCGLLTMNHTLICFFSFGALIAMIVYSYRIKKVLQAFLEVAQVDTTDRIKSIAWATFICAFYLVGNAIITVYSLVDVILTCTRVGYFFPAKWWWLLVASKHLLELAVLYSLLLSLWGSRETSGRDKYEAIQEYSDDDIGTLANVNGSSIHGIGPYNNASVIPSYQFHL